VTFGQDLKAWDQSEVMLEALKGILLVSRLIILVGSRSPIGPKQTMLDCSERGMMVELLMAKEPWRNRRIRTIVSHRSKITAQGGG